MKAYIRPLFVVLAIVLIGLAVRRGMESGNFDYFSLGIGALTLIMAGILMRKDQDGEP